MILPEDQCEYPVKKKSYFTYLYEFLRLPLTIIEKIKYSIEEKKKITKQLSDPRVKLEIDEFLVLYDLNNHTTDLYLKWLNNSPSVDILYIVFHKLVSEKQEIYGILPDICDINKS